MLENDIPVIHPRHTRLYILLALFVILGAIFFVVYRNKTGTNSYQVGGTKPTEALESKVVSLTPGEANAQEKLLSDPRYSEKLNLTAQQKAAEKKMINTFSVPSYER